MNSYEFVPAEQLAMYGRNIVLCIMLNIFIVVKVKLSILMFWAVQNVLFKLLVLIQDFQELVCLKCRLETCHS